MLLQQHTYNGLARPAKNSGNGLAGMYIVLVYGHRVRDMLLLMTTMMIMHCFLISHPGCCIDIRDSNTNMKFSYL